MQPRSPPVKLALFDLDHTLLDGDSDSLWGRFLVKEGAVDAEEYRREGARYMAEYRAGSLDIHEFLAFGLRPLKHHTPQRLAGWRARFMQECALARIPAASRALLQEHRAAGHTLAIITATNSFITAPIAAEFGVDALIATEPEKDGDRFTGRVAGPPCFREGKLLKLDAWLAAEGLRPEESWFYSDSHNDLPLLERVDHPVAVNPDEVLAQVAAARHWPVMQLRRDAASDLPGGTGARGGRMPGAADLP
ncbi:MAG TPA: HAD family phosphatase [Gammaproteobacteria bacterium]|jgi:HAD superfamily hydrolase (TIGR01490 family)